MGTLALNADERVASVEFSDGFLTVGLKDGRRISVPLAWYPRLAGASSSALSRGKSAAVATAYIGRRWMKISARKDCCAARAHADGCPRFALFGTKALFLHILPGFKRLENILQQASSRKFQLFHGDRPGC